MEAQPQLSTASRGEAPIGERTQRIGGSFRRISVHQLTLAWWLHRSGHMTRRQLRVYFAAHELHERRRYTSREHRGAKPRYTMRELSGLVGGRGSHRALLELRADVRALQALGLVAIRKHSVVFAVSADQILVDDLSGFWSMLENMPNRRRSVPVPRRTLRALAAGFSRGVTAVVIAMLIRGLFWHKQSGDYRTDGRYKLSWVAEHFGISRRAATDARAKLISLGWLEPLEVNQWEMNRWGLRDRIVTDWTHRDPEADQPRAVGEKNSQSASPRGQFDTESASPDQTDSLSLKGDIENRKLPTRERSGVSPGSTLGSRKKKWRRAMSRPPNIRDIRTEDLGSTPRLLDLYRQACTLGLAKSSESGRMDFLALAERSRARGRRAGALFYWLLREQKFSFITLADEDEAARRLREYYNGPRTKQDPREQWGGETQAPRPQPPAYTDDDKIVMACLRIARQRRLDDPFRAAQHAKQWTRPHWDTAVAGYENRRLARIQAGGSA